MEYVAITPHRSNYPDPIRLEAGDRVALGRIDDQYPGWVWVTSPSGNEGWAPESLIQIDRPGSGLVTDAYTARELDTRTGDRLSCTSELNGWLWVQNENGETGWVPRETVQFLSTNLLKGVNMQLGAFSVSLAVKDIEASRAFYQKFGFEVFGGDASQNWLILKNGDHVIGLFQGMFERNTLTFNPGWDSNATALDKFTDVRDLQRRLKEQGVTLVAEADETTTGPASLVAIDPDGNPILLDQHV